MIWAALVIGALLCLICLAGLGAILWLSQPGIIGTDDDK